jgi:hypothetical protein
VLEVKHPPSEQGEPYMADASVAEDWLELVVGPVE